MEQIFDAVINHTRRQLDVKRLKKIFGSKERPSRTKRKKHPRMEIVVERPTYDLTVFKIHFGAITVKLYTKGERVLRIETIIHNAKALGCRCSISNFFEIVSRLRAILNRFLDTLSCIDVRCIADSRLDELPTPSQVGQTRVGGVDINSPRIRVVTEAVISLAAHPKGFTSSELAKVVQACNISDVSEYTPRKAAYDLKKFRGKNLIRKLGKSRRYETVPEGLKTMAALFLLKEKIIKPVLAGVGKRKPGPKHKNPNPLNKHYQNIQFEIRNLFHVMGIAT